MQNGQGWTAGGNNGVSQTIDTASGQTYTISCDLAAHLASGATCGSVEVLWNGEAIGSVTATASVFATHSFEVGGDGGTSGLVLREVAPEASGAVTNMDGPIFSYTKDVEVGGDTVEVAAFAPGQSKLFQMIDGQLTVVDPDTEQYEVAGDPTGLRINATGFHTEDDLIYGIAKANGVDALGNPVSVRDLVMVDAEGNAYRAGETPVADYVGDFDDAGNQFGHDLHHTLWGRHNGRDAERRLWRHVPGLGGESLFRPKPWRPRSRRWDRRDRGNPLCRPGLE